MRVLVATDGSPASVLALDWAARLFPAEALYVVAVAQVPAQAPWPGLEPPLDGATIDRLWQEAFAGALAALEQARRRLAASGVRPAQTFVRQGDVPRAILDLARGLRIDLIIVGRRQRPRLMRALFGSVSEALLRASPSGVLVARADASGPRSALALHNLINLP